jgi:hypothetical protein
MIAGLALTDKCAIKFNVPQAPPPPNKCDIMTATAPKKILSFRAITTIVLTIMALIAFNLSQPGIQSINGAAFNSWYPHGTAKLTSQNNEAAISIAITLNRPSNGESTSPKRWDLPNKAAHDTGETMKTPDISRVLQLIYESKVFELSPVTAPLNQASGYLTITIADNDNRFETTVGYRAIEESIQLRNLVALLESST